MILSPVKVVDSWWLAKGDIFLTFWIMDRWYYHPSNSLTRGDSPREISPWLLRLWIDDLIVRYSRWLFATRQGGFSLDFWDYGSMMISSVQVFDSWKLAKKFTIWLLGSWMYDTIIRLSRILVKVDFSLTFGIVHRWFYHPSEALTRGDTPRGFPLYFWDDGSMILSSVHSLTCKGIYLWLFGLIIDVSIVRPSRWLLLTRQGDFPLLFGIIDKWSYHPSKLLNRGYSPRGLTPWLLELWMYDPIIRPFVDFWSLDKGDFSLNFKILDRWSYRPSKSLTCGQSPMGIFPWLFG